jgi:hypothetical protein
MIQYDECVISNMSVHKIVATEGKSILSDALFESSDENEDAVLKRLFLKPFQSHTTTFEFAHNINIEYNVLFGLTKKIVSEGDFLEISKNIAEHLIETSKHPNIKDGELFVVQFQDLQLGNKHYQALGIYKFEEKESYIETNQANKQIDLQFRKGLGTKKPDKACLIVFTDEPFTLLIIDSNSNETDYWQNEFIKHKSKNDNINNTTDFLTIAKTFITEQIPNEYEVNKTDQLNLLNRSVEYFKSHDTFNKAEFEQEVFEDKGIIKSFRSFDQSWQQDHELDISDNFEISTQAVKKQARIFKSILKLDKNFHIYIHGDRELIEHGVEKDGRKFYKIYYDKEN